MDYTDTPTYFNFSVQWNAMTLKHKPIDVAVGILLRDNGDVLLGQRPEGKPYAGYWEFPGGKVEQGESILDALKREFVEELGVQILSASPWCGVEYVYPHAHVRLHFYISRAWQGEPQSLEGQDFAWQGSFAVSPLLPATIPLLEWLDQLRHELAPDLGQKLAF
jgi:8-oxo-dGTP diphosphatase